MSNLKSTRDKLRTSRLARRQSQCSATDNNCVNCGPSFAKISSRASRLVRYCLAASTAYVHYRLHATKCMLQFSRTPRASFHPPSSAPYVSLSEMTACIEEPVVPHTVHAHLVCRPQSTACTLYYPHGLVSRQPHLYSQSLHNRYHVYMHTSTSSIARRGTTVRLRHYAGSAASSPTAPSCAL